jgi:hypothetical protein
MSKRQHSQIWILDVSGEFQNYSTERDDLDSFVSYRSTHPIFVLNVDPEDTEPSPPLNSSPMPFIDDDAEFGCLNN